MSRPYDLVIYGASGFTGAQVVESLTKYVKDEVKWAVAGRNEIKLRKVLADVSAKAGKNVRDVPIIIADSSDEQSLVDMAKQAKVVINAVGPYRLHGEAVVKAAVENGASHVDISGEPAWLEKMQMKYSELAKENGVYVVGACGWDSIPCDLGVNFTEQHFSGDLAYIETFVQLNSGPAGYSFNAGTYQTLILGLSEAASDGLGKIRRAIMPERVPRGSVKPPKRYLHSVLKLLNDNKHIFSGALFKHKGLNAWCLPFLGADKSIVNRSLYYGYTEKQERPFFVETYFRLSSLFWAVMLTLWMMIFAFLVKFKPTRKFLQAYPDLCTFNMFKESGPTREQMDQASFVYWFFGTGWDSKLSDPNEQHTDQPKNKIIVRCDGPDAGYYATSGCILSAALTILKDKDALPPKGGVFTTAAAFGRGTKIYERLKQFGITYRVVDSVE